MRSPSSAVFTIIGGIDDIAVIARGVRVRIGKEITVAIFSTLTLPSPTVGEGTSDSYFFADPKRARLTRLPARTDTGTPKAPTTPPAAWSPLGGR